MSARAGSVAFLIGAAAAMQFGGALKSAPPLAALPFDITLAAALLFAAALVFVWRSFYGMRIESGGK